MLAIRSPGEKFRFDAFGRAELRGWIVMKPRSVARVAVTFSTTDEASLGTPARPPTGTWIVVPARRYPVP